VVQLRFRSSNLKHTSNCSRKNWACCNWLWTDRGADAIGPSTDIIRSLAVNPPDNWLWISWKSLTPPRNLQRELHRTSSSFRRRITLSSESRRISAPGTFSFLRSSSDIYGKRDPYRQIIIRHKTYKDFNTWLSRLSFCRLNGFRIRRSNHKTHSKHLHSTSVEITTFHLVVGELLMSW
jgi:hypothetical protein